MGKGSDSVRVELVVIGIEVLQLACQHEFSTGSPKLETSCSGKSLQISFTCSISYCDQPVIIRQGVNVHKRQAKRSTKLLITS